MRKMRLPLADNDIKSLKVNDRLLISGIIYTARDQAHKKLVEAIGKGQRLPVDLEDAIIYYCGPTPAQPGGIIGSCGPTTSARMDAFTPILLEAGVKAMIGKGRRGKEVKEAIKRYKAVYFLAPAGCGALLSRKIKRKRLIAYRNLGPEAIFELEVEDFPVIVGIDSKGRDIFG